MKKLIFLFAITFISHMPAMKTAVDEYKQKMAAIVAAYDKPVSSSKEVVRCFASESAENMVIITTKRLFFHMCAQAAKDTNFKVNSFRDLMRDINSQEDTIYEHPIKTKYAAAFHKILNYIPWNGKTDTECGVCWHETMMNDRFVNLGFSAYNHSLVHEVYIFANNEDDFDSEMDHREKIEQEFKELLKKAK